MAKITPMHVTEQFEHFVHDLKESFWGDVYGQTRLAWKRFWEAESMRERDSYMKTGWYDRAECSQRIDYRNGLYQRAFVTGWVRFGCGSHEHEAKTFCRKGWRSFSAGPQMWRS
jgi:hypothetical protein